MKFNKEFGIAINEGIKKALERAIEREGSRFQLAKTIKINNQTIYNWQGQGARQGEFITWEQWKPLRDYLAGHGEIARGDPRWMLPSEMRDALENGDTARNDDEARLLQLYRNLTPDGQQTALNLMQSLQATLNKAPSGSATSTAG